MIGGSRFVFQRRRRGLRSRSTVRARDAQFDHARLLRLAAGQVLANPEAFTLHVDASIAPKLIELAPLLSRPLIMVEIPEDENPDGRIARILVGPKEA